MTDTQHQRAGGAGTIFTPDDQVETLWVKSYQGEIMGEIFFERIAERTADTDQRLKMGVLSRLERRTGAALVPALGRAGISTDVDPATLTDAESLADAVAALSWAELMATFEPVTTQFAAMYARIGELDPSEQDTADLLVAHELALREFARQELAGNGDGSLQAINALAHMQ
jgi:hypothetical protein